MTVKRSGPGLKAAVKKFSAKVGDKYDVGIFRESKYQDGTHVATVGFYNEFGTKTSPPRPFFRQGLKKSRKRVLKTLGRRLSSKRLRRSSAEEGAKVIRAELESQIINFSSPANAPSTVRRKGFNDPLIETGRMFDSLNTRKSRK